MLVHIVLQPSSNPHAEKRCVHKNSRLRIALGPTELPFRTPFELLQNLFLAQMPTHSPHELRPVPDLTQEPCDWQLPLHSNCPRCCPSTCREMSSNRPHQQTHARTSDRSRSRVQTSAWQNQSPFAGTGEKTVVLANNSRRPAHFPFACV